MVGNAIAHSPAAGVVAIAVAADGDAVTLCVDDQGPGVAAADRERIFLPFARGGHGADRAGDEPDDGVGLGLSVARRIVEAHRGRIAATDAPGGGARFVVRLPAA
ncbi:MAG: hypothetical protein H6708_25455 [Kofleriaceae bacterium]|nr:hypothetical protein [Kofleriaceae bacterium]